MWNNVNYGMYALSLCNLTLSVRNKMKEKEDELFDRSYGKEKIIPLIRYFYSKNPLRIVDAIS